MNKPHLLAGTCLALSLASAAWAQPEGAQRPNQPVFRSGPWFVVRSVREGGNVVACTGFYRANRGVQLSKDSLVIKTRQEIRTVSLGFDGKPLGAPRPLSAAEKQLGAVALTGEDFAQLGRSSKLRLAIVTDQGSQVHELELRGLKGALDNINAGCPVPDKPLQRPMPPGQRQLREGKG